MTEKNSPFDYLCIHEFMKGLIESRALLTAFELGIIDFFIRKQPAGMDEIKKISKSKGHGFTLLMDLLTANNVTEEFHGKIKLTKVFTDALSFRDIMVAMLQFATIATSDFTDLFSVLISEPEKFYSNSRIINLFGYNLSYDNKPENVEHAKLWMNITTTLTRYEAPVCISLHDFSRYRHIVDIGGNSGEFALQICKRHHGISATVFDLPLVCDIGRKHVGQYPEANKITFQNGNAFRDPLPKGADLIIFKSMLHDWPDDAATHLLSSAAESLDPGGSILIFERAPLKLHDVSPPYSILPFLLFSQSFRTPALYIEHLEKSGFSDITVKEVNLEMPFFLLCAVKK